MWNILRKEVLELARVFNPRGATADDAEGEEAINLTLWLPRNARCFQRVEDARSDDA
jgi:hypothetical protein